jgi:hypothetical protein
LRKYKDVCGLFFVSIFVISTIWENCNFLFLRKPSKKQVANSRSAVFPMPDAKRPERCQGAGAFLASVPGHITGHRRWGCVSPKDERRAAGVGGPRWCGRSPSQAGGVHVEAMYGWLIDAVRKHL